MENLRTKKSGFTLVEILVTVVILGIMIVPITKLIIFTIWGTGKTKDYVVALTLAKEKMERIKMLSFESVEDELNDIFTQDQLDKNPDSEAFLKDFKDKYLYDYEPFDEKLARFSRTVDVDEKVDKIHKDSILKKITVTVKNKIENRTLCTLVTYVCNY
jgi:prepilin-type N-terminal cleavage/methylation domain-containing protein